MPMAPPPALKSGAPEDDDDDAASTSSGDRIVDRRGERGERGEVVPKSGDRVVGKMESGENAGRNLLSPLRSAEEDSSLVSRGSLSDIFIRLVLKTSLLFNLFCSSVCLSFSYFCFVIFSIFTAFILLDILHFFSKRCCC